MSHKIRLLHYKNKKKTITLQLKIIIYLWYRHFIAEKPYDMYNIYEIDFLCLEGESKKVLQYEKCRMKHCN
jgi:hypothetical protein